MLFVQAVLTIALLLISSLGPGLIFIRYLRWRPLETLCGSVALSFLLLYLEALIIYALNLTPSWAYLPSVFGVLSSLACASDLRRLWRHREARCHAGVSGAIFLAGGVSAAGTKLFRRPLVGRLV